MDCLEGMQEIPANSIDLILADPPFGTTQNGWDTPILLGALWGQLIRIKKENTAIILFGSGMFTAEVMASNKKMWKYNLVWEKGERATGFLNSHKMPLRSHEDIMVFYQALPTYNPQFSRGAATHKRGAPNITNNTYGDFKTIPSREYGNQKFPKSVLKFDKPHPPIHPSEKPVDLCEYLIKTYSNENDTVLDFCIGSGTTAEACIRTGRNFIGFEKEPDYFTAASTRATSAMAQGKISGWFA
jgi:site-specific DNA-methyltransferase (adenine-specific)